MSEIVTYTSWLLGLKFRFCLQEDVLMSAGANRSAQHLSKVQALAAKQNSWILNACKKKSVVECVAFGSSLSKRWSYGVPEGLIGMRMLEQIEGLPDELALPSLYLGPYNETWLNYLLTQKEPIELGENERYGILITNLETGAKEIKLAEELHLSLC